MEKKRVKRINSLMREVLSEVILKEVKDPRLAPLVTVTNVEITNDLQHAKVSISVIGTDKQKRETLEALQSAAGFIAISSSKKMVIRFFPALTFKLDTSADEQMRIDALIDQIHQAEKKREDGAV